MFMRKLFFVHLKVITSSQENFFELTQKILCAHTKVTTCSYGSFVADKL